MSALKYLLVISCLSGSAPERPAKDNNKDFKRLYTPPEGCNGSFWLSANSCVCNKASPAVQKSHCCHSIALEPGAA